MRQRSIHRYGTGIVASAMMLALLGGCSSAAKPDNAKPAVPVAIAIAASGPAAVSVSGIGHVQGVDTALVRAQTSGQLVSVNFIEGQTVSAGQALAMIDPRPLQATLAQDVAALARDQAALANARDNVTRSVPLVSQGLASAQQVEAYRSQAAQLAAAVAGDRATIQRDRLMLAYATIRAPIAGVTGVRLVDTGNIVSPTDANGLVTIVKVQPIAVLFTLPQADVTRVRAALTKAGPAGIAVDALNQDGGAVLDTGRLLMIDNRVDDQSGTVQLKAVFPNANKQLWPGQLLAARIALGGDASAVSVPASAIQGNPQGAYVWVVDGRGVASMRQVSPGAAVGSQVIITKGLSGGERIVTDGQFALTNGAQVRVTRTGHTAAPLRADNPDQLGLQL